MQYSQSVRVNQLILTTTPLHTHTETAQFRPTHPTNQCIRTFPYFSRPNVSNQIACNDNSGGYVANHRDRAGGSGHDVVLIYEASSASNTVTNAAAPHSHPLAPALRLTRRSSLYSMECDVKRMYQFVAVSAFSSASASCIFLHSR